jgi:hypothetical protein
VDNYAFIELIIVFWGWRRKGKEAEGALLGYLNLLLVIRTLSYIKRILYAFLVSRKATLIFAIAMPLIRLRIAYKRFF